MNARGIDRKPTDEEAHLPPDKRPWTEYDAHGDKQPKPDFKACAPSLCCCIFGPTCCVIELQWCSLCGADADTTCDILCRCQTSRMKLFVCCGPQRNDVECRDFCPCCSCCPCCHKGGLTAGAEVSAAECCECDCIDNHCGSRYSGCQPPLTCIHVTCVKCPPCCADCCCCHEEILFMDGDLKPMHQATTIKTYLVETQNMERA